jgi:predicted HAD superfamily Cof-like phosphohydrolase
MTENKTYPSPTQLVLEFHRTYGQPIRTEPVYDIPEKLLRSELILEEASEIFEAVRARDIIEVVDGLADLIYVTAGAAITHGIDLDASFGSTGQSPAEVLKVVHKRQKQKIRPLPTLNVLTLNMTASGINKVAVSYDNYVRNTVDGDPDQLRSILTTLMSSCYFASFSIGVNIDEALEEVQRSNMSKLGEDGKPIYRADGKVLKGPNFSQPDIAAVLRRQGWKG